MSPFEKLEPEPTEDMGPTGKTFYFLGQLCLQGLYTFVGGNP